MSDACCLSMHLCCHAWWMMSQHAFMFSCLMHDVSACIYVVISDAWCLSMHLFFSCLMHDVSACIYVVMPDAWCLKAHLLCHAWCMICCSIYVIMPAWCMICRIIRIHLSRHVPALTFTILLQLEKMIIFQLG